MGARQGGRRMDETTSVRSMVLSHRAVDNGQTISLTARDEQAAKRFLTKAIRRHGVPEKITIDGSAANEAAIKSYNRSTARRSPSARSNISISSK